MQPAQQSTIKVESCLIVEDSAFDREKLTRVLRNTLKVVRVETASTLKAARRALAKADPALILLDNNLPDGLGADFVQELADDPRFANTPVIMVSDWPSPFMWEKAASAGVAYVVTKSEFDGRFVVAALEGKRARRLS